jgi:hypothetical protein
MDTSIPLSVQVKVGDPPFTAMGVNTTVVPGQNAPDGDEVKVTAGVTGAVTDSEPKLVPPTPSDIPAIPDAIDATILPAAATVLSGCTCSPFIIT